MNKRIMKKRAFSIVNEATEFNLRVKYPNTFIKEGYKVMKIVKARPQMFIKRGQRVEKLSKLTPEEAMIMWRNPESEEGRKRKQAIYDRYGKDVVFLSDKAFAEVMHVRNLKGLLRKRNRRK